VAMVVEMEMMEEIVEEGMSTLMGRKEEAVAIAEERRVIGVAFSRREVSAGSKPGGGCISRSKWLQQRMRRFELVCGVKLLLSS
jgi:hypothetical protein